MATANQMMPLSGQPKRFSFHIETKDRTTRTTARNTISRRLKALNVSSGCTRPICSWTASVSLLSGHLAAAYRVLELVELPYLLPPAAVL
jgi:hypothetical protein